MLAIGIAMFVLARRESKAADDLRTWAQTTGASAAVAPPPKTYDAVCLNDVVCLCIGVNYYYLLCN